MSALDMSPRAITQRLETVGRVSDLTPARRLDAKLDLSAAGLTSRLIEAAALYEACVQLRALGARSTR